jgi:DNA-binding transcriptional regulator YdaS (Cro superfamily)
MSQETMRDALTGVDSWQWFQNRLKHLGHASLNEFANHHGFPKSSLSRYFHRERQLPSGKISAFCEALQVSPEELLQAIGAIEWRGPDSL